MNNIPMLPRAPQSVNMTRGTDTLESRGGALFPFSNEELKDVPGIVRHYVPKCLLSVCCGPCMVCYQLERAGKTRTVSFGNGVLLIGAHLLKGAAASNCNTMAVAEGTAIFSLPSCSQAAVGGALFAASAIPLCMVATTLQTINTNWGGDSNFTAKYLCYLCFFESCFVFQFARAVDNITEEDHSLVSSEPMLASGMQ